VEQSLHAMLKCVSQLLDDVSFARLSSSGRSATFPAIDDMVDEVFESWDSALAWNPEAGIVANATSGHITALQELLTFGVPVLVEKPWREVLTRRVGSSNLPNNRASLCSSATALRFHPAVKRLMDLVVAEDSAQPVQCIAIVGQHIEDWRVQAPESTVSLSAQLGGGALLELSHEIDLAITLMGQVLKTEGFTSTPSRYEVEVAASLSMLHEQAVSSVSMNMLQRPAQRTFTSCN
jgi:predicted dehydrogenase